MCAPTQATVDWIFGGSHRLEGPSQQTRFDEDVFAINLNGEPLSTWAGPVSLATGFEYRKDGYNVRADPGHGGLDLRRFSSSRRPQPADPFRRRRVRHQPERRAAFHLGRSGLFGNRL